MARRVVPALAVFAGAALIFIAEPLAAKLVLPRLGGGPSVWTGCMLLFQALLLAGYAYAHLVGTRTKPGVQVVIHAVVLALGLALLPPSVALATGSPDANLPFAGSVDETFHSTAKEQSAESRVNQWRKARDLIEQRPVAGWGLGKTYTHYDPGHREFFTTNLTHNIVGDLLLRTGVIGVLLFSIAMLLAVSDGWTAWRRQQDDLAAALALASVAIIAGLLARGMVESLFEKFRLATLLGITLGIIGSVAVAPLRARARADRRLGEPEQAWS